MAEGFADGGHPAVDILLTGGKDGMLADMRQVPEEGMSPTMIL